MCPFQCFDLGARWGWVYKKRYYSQEKGKWIYPERAEKRRFRRSYISMARQNGKTFLNGITGTYIAGFSGYHFGKLFTVATKHSQAKLAWAEIAKFIKIDHDLSEFFKVKEYDSMIECLTTDCIIEALSRERGLDDGFRGIFISVDEIHQHKDNRVYKTLYNGTKALPETLVSMITTRGYNQNSFAYEMDRYCINILKGVAIAEDFFVDIYCLDKGDDYFEPKNWIKANPRLGATESGMESLQSDADTARDQGGSELRDFIIKTLNLWARNFEDQFIDVDKFLIGGVHKTLDDFIGKPCYVGLDLSHGGDLTTLALEFFENGKYYYYSESFMPRGRLDEHIETDLAPYDLWENDGLITVTGGKMDYKNDYSFIIKRLRDLQDEFNLTYLGIGYDPHNADGFLADLEAFDCPLLSVTQSAKFLNDATVDMQLNVKSEIVEFDIRNGLLIWSFSNAKVVKNSFGEIKVDKEPRAQTKRIDPVDACINAHVAKMKGIGDEPININDYIESYFNMFKH